jgi:hypothetical protein
MQLRYAAVCSVCGMSLPSGTEAWWDRKAPKGKRATCLACAEGRVADVAGASATAEGERRVARRVERVNARYGPEAAAVADHMAELEIAATWGKGGKGESRLAAYVARELGDAVIALHDRQVPGTRGNIDHIFVAASGVWVVDAKALKGAIDRRDNGPVWRPRNELYVGGRKRTSLAKGVEKQVECVLAALRLEPKTKGTLVYGALCLVESEWGLLDFSFQIGDAVWVLKLAALRKRLKKRGPLTANRMKLAAEVLDRALPPASG